MDDDLFPAAPRVHYRKSPLIQVISQLRFPRVLRIEGQTPADFQDQIRSMFPLVEKGVQPFGTGQVPAELPPEVVQFLGQQTGANTYRFLTEDRVATVTLLPDSLALSTTNYSRWEDFRELLALPLKALLDIYRPSFFRRIGLRYTNVIERQRIGLGDSPWSQLFRKEILAELAVPRIEESLVNANRVLHLKMPSNGQSVLLRHGLAQVQGRRETGYLVDFDFYTDQKVEVENADRTLSQLNRRAGRAFRWVIADPLHNALEPEELEPVANT